MNVALLGLRLRDVIVITSRFLGGEIYRKMAWVSKEKEM
jgi:hypothetical protein